MTIEISNPDLAALIRQRLQAGEFENVEDMLLHTLGVAVIRGSVRQRPPGRKSLAQLFAESPWKGLDLKIERDPDWGRPVEL